MNAVLHFDEGIRVKDGGGIMGHQMKDSFCSHKDLSHFAQLTLGLLRCNMRKSKVTLRVIDQTKILCSLIMLMISIKSAG